MDANRREHDERFAKLETRVTNLETGMVENTEITKRVEANTSELVILVKGAKGLRAFLMWVTPIAATLSIAYTYIKDHWK
jgi:hypothetical protein